MDDVFYINFFWKHFWLELNCSELPGEIFEGAGKWTPGVGHEGFMPVLLFSAAAT